jgi:hypothetical protein
MQVYTGDERQVHSATLLCAYGLELRAGAARAYGRDGREPARLFRRHARRKDAAILAVLDDEQVIDWDNNFRDDGALFLICSERDVEIGEYRNVLEQCIAYRSQIRKRAADG